MRKPKVLPTDNGHYTDQEYWHGSSVWSVARLVELSKDFDVLKIPLAHMNTLYEYDEMTLKTLSGHVRAVNNADSSIPIILDGDGVIMDGRHRLMKAIIEQHPVIKAVRFEYTPEPCRIDHSKEDD